MTKDTAHRRRPGRRLWIGIPGPEVDDLTARLLEEVRPGGIVLFRRNISTLDQVRVLVQRVREICGPDLLLSVDQEGGLVARFYRELTMFPGNMALGAAAFREPSLGEHLGEEQGFHMGRELRDLGFDLDLAPVVDLASRGDNPGSGIRSFGESPELVEKLGPALVRGLRRGGVHPCLKHFPGLGEATVDSHHDLPIIETQDLEPHLRPFQRGIEAGAPLVMTCHVIHRALDAERPATLSPAVTRGLLRERLGFKGTIMSDDLEMAAMSRHFGFEGTVRGASAAGHDVLCICHTAALVRQAHAILVQGQKQRAEWYGDPEAIEAHLDALKPLPAAGAPDRAQAEAVAEAIAGRAITIVRDDRRLLPLRRGLKVLLALPTLRGETLVENPLRGEEDGSALVEALGSEVELHSLPTEPTDRDIDALLLRAGPFDRLLLVLTNARFLESQRRLAQRAVDVHHGVIVLPIRSPFDLEVVRPMRSLTSVVSYGFRPVQLRALARVLRGEVESYGRLPVTLRPAGA